MFNVLHVGICSMKNMNILVKQYFHYGGYCMSEELKPCPFCGGEPEVRNGDFEKYKSSAIAYAWFVWVKGYQGDTVIKWIN